MNQSQPPERAPWHASSTLLEEYAALHLDVARSASVEQHLLGCDQCRTSLTTLTHADAPSADALEVLWCDVIDAVDRPRAGIVGSMLHRLGVTDSISKVVAATPALRLSWIVSILGVLGFAVMMAMRPSGSDAFLLVLAPLIPLAGIGTAYGAGADPLHELMRAAPLPDSRVFLYRSLAVLLTALPLTLGASLLLGSDGLVAMGWLVPSLGLVAATMALSTWVQPRLAAMAAGAAWVALVTGMWLRTGFDGSGLTTIFAFRPAGQLMFGAIAAAGGAVFAARFEQLDQPDDFHMEAS